jgi:hypothetical protein
MKITALYSAHNITILQYYTTHYTTHLPAAASSPPPPAAPSPLPSPARPHWRETPRAPQRGCHASLCVCVCVCVCACVCLISHATHKTKQTGVNSSKLEHITLYNNPERLHVPSPLRLLAAFMIPRYTESVCALVCTVAPIRALLTHTRRAVRAKELRRRVKEANIDSSDAIAT